MLKSKFMLWAASIFLPLFLPVVALASEGEEEFEVLPMTLDIISFILIIIAIVIIFKLIRSYGESAIGVSMVYFLIGTFFIGAIRLFLFLSGSGLISVDEITGGIAWHILHWLSVVMYFVAAKLLLGYVNNPIKPSYYKATVIGVSSLIFVLVMISTTGLFNETVEKFEGTILDRVGLIHFISFALGGILAIYLLKVKNKLIPAIAVIATPLLIVVALFSISHFWELLTESWKIVVLPGAIIEQTEQFITFPAYFLVVYAFWRSWSLLKSVLQ